MELYQFKLTELTVKSLNELIAIITVEGGDDPEHAHMLEKRALTLLAKEVEKGERSLEELKELARLVLSIKNIDFSRWFA
jgi:hypothetical protein